MRLASVTAQTGASNCRPHNVDDMTAMPAWSSHWSRAAKPNKPIRVVSIDPGTSNSTVSEIEVDDEAGVGAW